MKNILMKSIDTIDRPTFYALSIGVAVMTATLPINPVSQFFAAVGIVLIGVGTPIAIITLAALWITDQF